MLTKTHYNQTFKTQGKERILKRILEQLFFRCMGLSIRLTADFLSKIMKSIRWQEEKCIVPRENKSNNIVLSETILQKWRTNEDRIEMKNFVTVDFLYTNIEDWNMMIPNSCLVSYVEMKEIANVMPIVLYIMF